MHEQIANVMATQWERGSEWATFHARAFSDEIRSRVHEEIAACQDEKIRLLWVGAGKRFVELALEQAGIPVLPVHADMVDSRLWDGVAKRESVRNFLRQRVIPGPGRSGRLKRIATVKSSGNGAF